MQTPRPFNGKNATFQFFKEKGRGGAGPEHSENPARYFHCELPARDAIKPLLEKFGSDVLILCDGDVFSGDRLKFAQDLMRDYEPRVTHGVVGELQTYMARPPRNAGDIEMVGCLTTWTSPSSGRLQPFLPDCAIGVRSAIEYYVDLLLLRKRAFDIAPQSQELLEKQSKSTTKLANKNKGNASATDEILVGLAVAEASKNERTVCIVSYDDDIFSQAYKLWSVLCDDYKAHLLAEDFFQNPTIYGPRISLENSILMDQVSRTSDSFAVSYRGLTNHWTLYPQSERPWSLLVVKPLEKPHILGVTFPGKTSQFLEHKGNSDSRNTARFGDLNSYVRTVIAPEAEILDGEESPYLYLLADKMLLDGVRNRISLVDFGRMLFDESPKSMGVVGVELLSDEFPR
jgi:hypothetical protein